MKSNRRKLVAKVNPFLKDVLKNTPKGEDPKKGGRPYTPPGKVKMDGSLYAKAKRKKKKKA